MSSKAQTANHNQASATRRPNQPAGLGNLNKPAQSTHPAALLERLELTPGSLTPSEVLRLQRLVGNQATGRLLVQLKQQHPLKQRKNNPDSPGNPNPIIENLKPSGAVQVTPGPAHGVTAPLSRQVIQRLPIRNSTAARQEVRATLIHRGYHAYWDALVTRIGSLTIRDDVGIDNLITFMLRHNNDVNLIAQVINNSSPADIAYLINNFGRVQLFRAIGTLRLPTDQEVDRYYTNYLRDRIAAGAPPNYAADMYDTFRQNMRTNGGQYWDFTANTFRGTTEAYRDVYNNAPVDGGVFSTNIYSGQNVNFVAHTLAPVAHWVYNPASATGFELSTFLNNVPGGFSRPFTPEIRRAIQYIHGHPQGAQTIINSAVNVAPRLGSLLEAVRDSNTPAQTLTALNLVLNPPVGAAVAAGFGVALNHLDLLSPAAARLNPLRNHMPFGNRAGGLRGHFIKHPLGVQDAEYQADGLWESQQWMATLGLAPNGLITRGNFAALPHRSLAEWRIFGYHAHNRIMYLTWYYDTVNNASRPTNAAEIQAMITYLQEIGRDGADAASIAAAHQNVYQTYVSNQFDGAAPNRYLYYDANNLKVNAMAGNLFMVAAWNGNNFDLSSGFKINNGGVQAQFDHNLAQKIMDV